MSASSYHRRVLVALLLIAAAILPVTAAGAAPPRGTPVLHQTAELVSRPLAPDDNYLGHDVAVSGDGSTIAVTGATYNYENYDNPPTVVVRARSGGRWLTQLTLKAPAAEAIPSPKGVDAWRLEAAISADGDTLAVADPRATVPVGGTSIQEAGEVRLYTRSGQTWSAAGRLVAPHPLRQDRFGLDVSMSGDGTRVVVASGPSGSEVRHAYIADTRSRRVQPLPAPAQATGFGYAVAISPDGDTIVVAAQYGRQYQLTDVFVLVDDPATGWTRRWFLRKQRDEEHSGFGHAVAVSDTGTVVVGAPFSGEGVSVFDRRGTALVRTAHFTPRYTFQDSYLGWSVAVSADGSTVVAGAPHRSAAGGSIGSAGAAYRWVRSPGGWSWGRFLSKVRPNAGASQGNTVAVSADGRVIAVGSPGRSSPAWGRTGAVLVFSDVP